MSLYDYQESLRIGVQDPSFYSLIMAAFRKADTYNLHLLRQTFPEVWEEFEQRWHAPAGVVYALDGLTPEEYAQMMHEAHECEGET